MNPFNPPITFEPPFANEGETPAATQQPTAASAATDPQEGAHEALKDRVREKMLTYYKADMTLQFALALAPHVVGDRLHNGTPENQAKLLWSIAEALTAGTPAWVVEGINSVG